MKELYVELKEIKCNKTQDPKFDEIYFITAVNGKANDSDTVRRIKDGDVEKEFKKNEKILFKGDVEDDAPIIITVMEQRAVKDKGKLQKKLIELADKGMDKVKAKVLEGLDKKEEIFKVVAVYVLDKVVDLFEKVFRDEALGYDVIPPEHIGEWNIDIDKEDYSYNIKLSVNRK